MNVNTAPSWDTAPDWANYLAQDSNNAWCWFDSPPIMKTDTWNCADCGRFQIVYNNTSWKSSLQARPVIIEEDSIWICNGRRHVVLGTGMMRILDIWYESVMYTDLSMEYTLLKTEFINEFTRDVS